MSVIPLAAMLVHHCVDEDGMVCIEMHAPTIREMAIAAKEEHDALRARIAELERDADEWYALYQAEEDRREKAEAERNRLKAINHRLHVKVKAANDEYARQLSARERERTEQRTARMNLELQVKKRTRDKALLRRIETAETALSEITAICQDNSDFEVTDPVSGVNDLVKACNGFAHRHIETEAEIARKNILIAERDRYLAAIVEYVGVEDVKEIEVAYAALRRIAEEKP